MIDQPELQEIKMGTLPATFDMCQVGQLKLPRTEAFLQKRTQVHTTSRKLFEWLNLQMCPKNHDHQPIKGKFQYEGKWTAVSAYAQAYTATFARRVVCEMLRECKNPERPLLEEELILGLDLEHEKPEVAQESLQLKRRRVELKQPESSLYGRAPSWKDIFRTVGYETPRVGGHRIEADHVVVKLIQQLVPEFTVKLVISCRGTDRHRIDGVDSNGDRYPWRKTVVVDRVSGEVRETGPAEEWVKLPRLKQIRGTGPAKLSLSIFGVVDTSHAASFVPENSSGNERSESVVPRVSTSAPKPEISNAEVEASASDDVPMKSAADLENPDPDPVETEEDLAPLSIPKSGPKFLSLSPQERSDLKRLHVNLGHPDPAKFAKFLGERGANAAIVDGAKDMCCDTCVETQNKPKLSQPGRIHVDLDFNDVVGADGAYWKNKNGRVFHFMHFIDEATLYHVGALSERKVENQIQVFQESWVQWAGPCKTLYLDPAGEYVNDACAAHLQGDGTRVSMTAAEAHWQNGRSESHGKIVKMMLSRMEKDLDISTEAEFSRCLRQVFAAKNSLSRVNGFTPEQCLLGKARHLPGSLVSDSEASSHALADSETPEGLRFRQSLLRREIARKAYVQADNDSSFRRALLRQSRPGKVEYTAGDWVLYWRSNKSNNRVDRGRWHGPAQVVVGEKKRVVWVSHLGRLIRASPEQLRPASLREFSRLPRDAEGRVRDEKPEGRNYLELDEIPEEVVGPSIPEGDEYSPGTPLASSGMSSQPEQEDFPNEVPEIPETEGSEHTSNGGDEHGPVFDDGPRELSPHEIPIPDGGDDDLLFGDDMVCGNSNPGVWEFTLDELEWDINVAEAFCEHPEIMEQVWLTTGEKRKRVEVNYREQTPADQALFDAAKAKEVKAWMDHGTVKRVTRGTLSADQVMRCRWILTWKSPAPGSNEKRAKARLVVLGFEDPQIQSVASDAPTLSKDAKQLLLQQVASRRWRLINFDISTAFLKGHGDGRPLGLHAPPELRESLGMRDGDQCALMGGAYGRVDAPILWYRALRATLEQLGFVACPYDGCLFSLVTPGKDGRPRVRGILGVHVDDGLGGGDSYFHEVLGKLRKIYDFGAYNEGEFEFCGVKYKQWDDGTIEMDQGEYLNKIEPIEIPRLRRMTPNEDLTPVEVQQLRRICGSLQFAAVHTRPDLSAKVGILQSMVTKGKVQHLIDANRVLYESKRHPVCLMVVPIPEERVTFCTFSDASFSTAKDLSSRQGTLIFSTDLGLVQNKRTVVCPVAWSSRRIPRVVTSTLSAEAIALSSSLDRLGFIRICWEWIKDPSIDWSDPSKVLQGAPLASAVTDCKSVYDIATKTSTPNCSEYRTTLECLLIRERLQENMVMRWISTQAMLADSLTKTMDSYLLRECLRTGRYALFDEQESLKQRFTSGAAIIIGLSQLKYMLGIHLNKSQYIYVMFMDCAHKLSHTNWMTLLLGALCLIFLLCAKVASRRYKRLSLLGPLAPLMCCMVGTLLIWLCEPLRDTYQVSYVGKIPNGLFPVSLDAWNFNNFGKVLPTALSCCLIGYMESIAIGKNLAAKHGYELEAGQELLALGLSNVIGSLFSSYPVTGSFSRSAVNNATGAQTQLAGLVTSLVMLCTLKWLTPLFNFLPDFVLAAIVISSVAPLVAYQEAFKLWRIKKYDFFLWVAAFLGTLFLGVLTGIALAVGLSLSIVIYESVRPQITILWRLPGTTIYRNVKQEGCGGSWGR
eukprot:s2024_g14.t1